MFAKELNVPMNLNPMMISPRFAQNQQSGYQNNEEILYVSRKFSEVLPLLKRENVMTHEFLNGIKAYFDGKGRIKYPSLLAPCFAGIYSFVINQKGDVFPCYHMEYKKCGNVKNENIYDILTSVRFKLAIKEIMEYNCPTCWQACYAPSSLSKYPNYLLKQLITKFLVKSKRKKDRS